jgi:hypothetical protein
MSWQEYMGHYGHCPRHYKSDDTESPCTCDRDKEVKALEELVLAAEKVTLPLSNGFLISEHIADLTALKSKLDALKGGA